MISQALSCLDTALQLALTSALVAIRTESPLDGCGAVAPFFKVSHFPVPGAELASVLTTKGATFTTEYSLKDKLATCPRNCTQAQFLEETSIMETKSFLTELHV